MVQLVDPEECPPGELNGQTIARFAGSSFLQLTTASTRTFLKNLHGILHVENPGKAPNAQTFCSRTPPV